MKRIICDFCLKEVDSAETIKLGKVEYDICPDCMERFPGPLPENVTMTERRYAWSSDDYHAWECSHCDKTTVSYYDWQEDVIKAPDRCPECHGKIISWVETPKDESGEE